MTLSTLAVHKRIHRITLQNPGPPVPDGEGGYTESWTDLAPPTQWAAILPATAANMERFGPAGILQTKAQHLINVPFHPAIRTETRVGFNGRTFFVVGIQNPEERNVELWLAVEERVNPSGAGARVTSPATPPATPPPEDLNA